MSKLICLSVYFTVVKNIWYFYCLKFDSIVTTDHQFFTLLFKTNPVRMLPFCFILLFSIHELKFCLLHNFTIVFEICEQSTS